MELKNFKEGDTIVQKNDPSIRWVVTEIDLENNLAHLCRKGGYFNEMLSKFNGDNVNFEAAGRTEQRIKREAKIERRQKKQETFLQKKKENNLQQINVLKQLKPKQIAEIASIDIKDVLAAIHNGALEVIGDKTESKRGVRYVIDYNVAMAWVQNKNQEEQFLSPKEIVQGYGLKEPMVRNAIKNGELQTINKNEGGKIGRYFATKKWIDQWFKNLTK